MKSIQDIYLLFIRNLKKTLNPPIWLLLGLLQPALYLILYMPLLKNIGNTAVLPLAKIAQIFVPGMLIIMAISCLFSGFAFIPEIREGFITRLLVTPVSRSAIMISRILNQVFSLLLQVGLLLFLSMFLGLRVSFLSIVLTLILVVLIGTAMTSISYIISLTTKNEDALASLVNTLYLPIMLLSGIMLPISLAPQWLKSTARLNPFYYAVEAARALFLGNFSDRVILEGFGIMALFAFVSVWLSVRALRKMTA